jgi:spermidine synthase
MPPTDFPASRRLPIPVIAAVEDPVMPIVHDDAGVRCLRFNNGVIQSAMRVDEPLALDLSYSRTMMGVLLFVPEPRHVLIVGLGGGSLPKFCYHALPAARITTVEINPAVIALREQFLIPPDDERFRIIEADAGTYLAQTEIEADVILLDAYDANGLPPHLCSSAFYADCRRALGARGVLATNLWNGTPDRGVYIDRLNDLFDGRVWWSKPKDATNLVVFAVQDARFFPQWARLDARARTLDAEHSLGLAQVVLDLRARNPVDNSS